MLLQGVKIMPDMEKLVNFFHYCIINHKKTQIAKSKYSKKYLAGKKIGQKKSAINKNRFGKKRNNKKKWRKKNWQKNKLAENKGGQKKNGQNIGPGTLALPYTKISKKKYLNKIWFCFI